MAALLRMHLQDLFDYSRAVVLRLVVAVQQGYSLGNPNSK
jgi:hypothetical protein